MTLPPDPIKRIEGAKNEEPIIVNPIESDKKGKNNERIEGEINLSKQHSKAYEALLVFIEKLTCLFDRFQNQKLKTSSQDELIENLSTLKNLLYSLTQYDQRDNRAFCLQLSDVWHNLSQILFTLHRSRRRLYLETDRIKKLLTHIDHYPKKEEHQLGYYLTKQAGKDWLPTPFMDILQKLHRDCKLNPKNNTLEKWIQMIDNILDRMH